MMTTEHKDDSNSSKLFVNMSPPVSKLRDTCHVLSRSRESFDVRFKWQ